MFRTLSLSRCLNVWSMDVCRSVQLRHSAVAAAQQCSTQRGDLASSQCGTHAGSQRGALAGSQRGAVAGAKCFAVPAATAAVASSESFVVVRLVAVTAA